MNLISRTVTGAIMIVLGLVLTLLPVVAGTPGFVAWIYGIPILILGIIIFFNKREDKIEKIKHRRKK